MPIEIPKDKWTGSINTLVIGATSAEGGTRAKSVSIGGQTTMPYLKFDAMPSGVEAPNKPVIAIEIKSRKPDDWSPLLVEVWGEAMSDPAQWAKKAEGSGADLIVLSLTVEDNPDDAVNVVKSVLGATGLPLIVWGPGQAEKDNELLVPVSEATKGERLVLGICEDKNYRTIVATAMANEHLVQARAPMDVNLSKQLNILISDMGMSRDRILMDPTTGALGYGIEYGYSVMERLRLAALQGDVMTQLPMIVTPGYEAWKTKEAKVGEGVPEAWGDWKNRAIHWETLTAMSLVESGADIIVLRHPESVKRIKEAIDELITA
jgi:acetyl-CoA decarbonylase/synthase, CODH/ACS complex subunit delta